MLLPEIWILIIFWKCVVISIDFLLDTGNIKRWDQNQIKTSTKADNRRKRIKLKLLLSSENEFLKVDVKNGPYCSPFTNSDISAVWLARPRSWTHVFWLLKFEMPEISNQPKLWNPRNTTSISSSESISQSKIFLVVYCLNPGYLVDPPSTSKSWRAPYFFMIHILVGKFKRQDRKSVRAVRLCPLCRLWRSGISVVQ